MYLTRDEFLILQAFKQGKGRNFLEKNYGIRLCTNDPRIESLLQKYGIEGEDIMYYERSLSKKADLNKAEIIEADKMPYYDYDFENNLELVKRIPISKKDVIQLLKTFEKPAFNDTDCFYLQYKQDGWVTGLDLIDNNKHSHHVRYCIDGDYCIGDDLKSE